MNQVPAMSSMEVPLIAVIVFLAILTVYTMEEAPAQAPVPEPAKHTGSAFASNASAAVVGFYLLCYVMVVF
ncbi:hypothetical protein PVL29_017681 [Vitis rotundifolia]|uniref:Uncharacterized protein n=1 Tax=Vitis rotundifolia TaxID=103349 RepID=A0AA38ZBW7_VITRO|nr:hypothetical protein PVL29_017681 [Vitis rotundifolia]